MKDKDSKLLEENYEQISKWGRVEEILHQNTEQIQRMMKERRMINLQDFIIAALKSYMGIK